MNGEATPEIGVEEAEADEAEAEEEGLIKGSSQLSWKV